ncbi:MAG: ATP-binding cassette domain-containing protein [Candidatus Delongbacteria bacterium]|nr:ATP-binding cassette domain-containing protein [Candidatus Delongbacteria bacterium]MBN2834386.1 ATP-binding cassette domain-containing protein [Candidatus Delongbacteria bacterium]
MSTPFLKIDNVSKSFDSLQVLKDIELFVENREFVSLLGPSGCGKTTLLRIIAGLEEASQGRVILEGNDITSLCASKRNFGIVFQSYALFPNLNVFDNVSFGLKNKKTEKKIIQDKVKEVLDLVGLYDKIKAYPAELSGGQQQRVALARVLVLSPKLLLLDEPLSALDAKVRVRLRKELRRIHEQLKITTIMVTHDQEEAISMSDKIAVMNKGIIVQNDTPKNIYDNPENMFVADFIGNMNFIKLKDTASETKRKFFAIRPEHIEIARGIYNAENSYQGMIRDIEFKGNFYRVSFEVDDFENQIVEVDVPASELDNKSITRNQKYSINLNQSKLLIYNNGETIY